MYNSLLLSVILLNERAVCSSNNFSPSILVLFKKDVIFVVSNFFPQEQ